VSFKRAVLSLILLIVLVDIWYFVPPARLFVLWMAGRSPECPLPKALRAFENLRRYWNDSRAIRNSSRLLQKDPSGFHLWETPRGRFWIPSGSDEVLPVLLAEQQNNIYGSGDQAVRAGDTVLDVGANVGVFTRTALSAGASLVVLIEPAPENVECLRRNYAAEIVAGRVVVVPKGVWNKEDVLTMYVDPANSAADNLFAKRKGSYERKVPLTTIDDIVAELKLAKVTYVKIDVEGAEQQALEGAQHTLARWRPRLSIAVDNVPDDPVKVPALVRKAWPGYRMACGPCRDDFSSIAPVVQYFW